MHARNLTALCAGLSLISIGACVAPAQSFNQGAEITATPQRPSFSNSVYTTAPETLELETGLQVDPGDSMATPSALKYGLNERAEAFVGLSPGTAVEGGGVGFGDMQLGWRQRLNEINTGQITLAYQAVLNLPTGDEDKGLGSGEFEAFAAGIGTLPMESWSATGFAQLGLVGERRGSAHDAQFAWAAAADHNVGEGASVFSELAGVFTPDQDFESVFTTLGGTWSPSPGLVLDVGFVVGLSNDAPDFQFVIGFTRNLGPLAGRASRAGAVVVQGGMH